MAWVATGVAVAGTLMGGKDASDGAGEASASQARAMAEQLAFDKQRYKDQWDIYGPATKQLMGEAMAPGSLDWDINKGAIEDNYTNAGRQAEQSMTDQGMDPNGTTGQAIKAGMNLRKAQDLSKQWATGVMNKRQLATAMLGHDGSGAAASAVSGSLGNQASMYGNQVGMYTNMANQASSSIGNALSTGVFNWQHGKAQTSEPWFPTANSAYDY